jgi:type IV secretory pathway TraG/TraD family ATPase VirD4
VVFGSPDEDTAKWCSNSLGNTEIEEFKEGLSYGAHEMRDGVNLNISRTMRHLVLPSEIMNLANLNAYVKLANNYPVAKVKLEYIVRDKIAARFTED